jgi:hypothetical protein
MFVLPQHCTPFALPSLGVIIIDPTSTITLSTNAVFTPECTAAYSDPQDYDPGGPSSITDMRDPFNASVTPQVYATGAATVIAWMLVIMLLITPRTFFVGGVNGTSGLLGRRGVISGAQGGASIIGVGSRPWLQKVAALTVAISMTIATADTFRVAEQQYEAGYMDAMKLRDEVVGGLVIKISRIISDIFLWLAQVQTLIRLFSRHKEKVIIKWVGFALIILDMTFSILNSFLGNGTVRARHFENAIPALNYLFQCALSMLYAAWVIYYSITKRRYAFYHPMMWNITLVAVLSIVAILTPLVFFITDISNYSVAGWGDYFRWVGAAAASVIVWEWVERIEALEREEKKDGILGREIFDGDDMLEVTASEEVNWPRHRHSHHHHRDHLDRGGRGGGPNGGAYSSGIQNHRMSRLPRLDMQPPTQESRIMVPLGRQHTASADRTNSDGGEGVFSGYRPVPEPPQPVASPVSRTDTTSATSTVYTIRYHTLNEPTTPQARHFAQPPASGSETRAHTERQSSSSSDAFSEKQGKEPETTQPDSNDDAEAQHPSRRGRTWWDAVADPFKRRKASPPREVLSGRVIESVSLDKEDSRRGPVPANHNKWDIRSRLGAFAAEQSEKIREKTASNRNVDMNLPVTIIPAQPRGGRTWSPDVLTQQQRQARPNDTAAAALHHQQATPLTDATLAGLGMSPVPFAHGQAFSSANRPTSSNSLGRPVNASEAALLADAITPISRVQDERREQSQSQTGHSSRVLHRSPQTRDGQHENPFATPQVSPGRAADGT